jgi:Calcineurin-like phosphoesterase
MRRPAAPPLSSMLPPGAALVIGLMMSLGCSRTPEMTSEQRPAPPTPGPKAMASDAPRGPATSSYKLPGGKRVVAIGDVHGDLTALRGALRLAGAIDSDDAWIGGDLVVVQTGDQIDRGDQDREVLDVLERLEASAKAAGGALHVLLGNHELMNAVFDFRYVTRRSFESFDELKSQAGALSGKVPESELGRAAAFAPGAPYARKLSPHLTVALVGDTLFAHGGVLPHHVDYGLDRINREASGFLAGSVRELPRALSAEDAPVWTRAYGAPEVDAAACQALSRVLLQVGAKRLVVGHTVQEHGISSACDGRLYRIDIGLSAYYGVKPPQVLEITAAGARVLSAGARPTGAAKSGKAPAPELHSAP